MRPSLAQAKLTLAGPWERMRDASRRHPFPIYWSRRALTLLTTIALLILCVVFLVVQKVKQPVAPRPKPPLPTIEPVRDNFPLAASATSSRDLPPIPTWNKPEHVSENTPLFIGFTRNWPILQQAVVSYLTAGWPSEDIYVVDNTGTFLSNKNRRLTLQNPFYFDYHRLTEVFGINVVATPTLLSFAQLQNFYLYTALENGWGQYFWSHMDVLALPEERKKPYTSLYHRAVETLRESTAEEFGKWGIRFFAYDRLALVNVEAFVDVGAWDTFIPFYGTDCDMHERLAMNNWSMTNAANGFIYDMGLTLPDLRVLYREDSEENRKLCPDDAPEERLKYGLADCRFEGLIRAADDLQNKKWQWEGGRNFWQNQQMGGQGEPFYRDPVGFEKAIGMTTDYGKDIMYEKWGHVGCNIRHVGLTLNDQWRVFHDKDWDQPKAASVAQSSDN